MDRDESFYADSLHGVAGAIARGATGDAERRLQELLADVERTKDPAALCYYVFGAALARRLSQTVADEANLYLSRFELPQIHLFNILAAEVPQVGLTTIIANRSIAHAIAEQPDPVVIDVGIGTGRQMTDLLALLHATDQLPTRMTLVGIEPSSWSLELAEKNVLTVASKLGVDLSFVGLCNVVERLAQNDWRRVAEICRGRPAINASFALHHVSDVEGRDARDDVLLRLRSLNPSLLVLAEPNVDHLEPDFMRRFENCFHHFSTTFRVVDRLPIGREHKDAIKVFFFGREITDILGGSEGERSERHEIAASWLRRLARTGYGTRVGVDALPSGPLVGVTHRGGHVTLDFETEPLVAVVCAYPVGGAYDVDGALSRAPARSVQPVAPSPIDVGFYLSALAVVARRDAVLRARERSFIEEQARVFGVGPETWQTATLDDVLARLLSTPPHTREAIVRDMLFLARLDNDYDPTERETISAISQRLGVSNDEFALLERSVTQPPVVAGGPSWFRKLWYLSRK